MPGTELTVRAAEGGGLAPADLPTVDLDLLVRALTAPPAPTAALPGADPATKTHAASGADAPIPAPTTSVDASGSAPAHAATVRPARTKAATKATRHGAGAANTSSGSASSSTNSRRAGKMTTGRKSAATRTSTRAAAASTGEGGRAYRRMPDAAEVLAAYAQTGTITRLADHFGVPRHTVTGWARRLREQGHAIGRR